MTPAKLLIAMAFLLSSLTAQAQVPASLQQRLQDTLNYMQSHYHFKGLTAAVAFKGIGTWSGTAGVSEDGVPMSSQMLIGIGSNTKTFVSALMLKLCENGQVKLSDTIGTWVQGYANINGAITIRQLLNHTSGLFNYTNHPHINDSLIAFPTRIWTREELLHSFVNAPLFTPGNGWSYSNTNYLIAGLIEVAVTGRPLHQLMRDSILAPCQLNETFFPPYETATLPYAHSWSVGASGQLEDMGYPVELYSVADAAGGMVSTAADNTKFWLALFDGKIIRKSTIKNDMLNWVFGVPYGLGIFREYYSGNMVFSHGGTYVGQIHSNLIDTVRGISISVLSNQDSLLNDFTEKVVAALYKVALTPTVSVSQVQGPAQMVFYPNPATGILRLRDALPYAADITLIAMDGRHVYHHRYQPHEPVAISVQDLPAGHYMAQVAAEGRGTQSVKIVVGK